MCDKITVIVKGRFARQVETVSSRPTGLFIATQLNSTRRRVELSCVAINGPLSLYR